MADDLIFMMGKFEARIPRGRLYSPNHMWLLADPDVEGEFRVGFSAYSVRLLQDVYFLDWSIDAQTAVKDKQEIGEIESSKAVSSLYPAGPGVVTAFNEALLDDPSAINTDNYQSGWLYRFRCDEDLKAKLLDAEAYVRHLESGWERDQRMIKGQMN